VTNFGALAVLAALREHDARSPRGQRRLRTVRTQSLLTALETFPAGADGWREVSAETLREAAELNPKAFDQGRRELIGAKLIEYQPGTHRGEHSRWRITFAVDESPEKKGATQSGDLPGPKGPHSLGTFRRSPDSLGTQPRSKGVPLAPERGPLPLSSPLTSILARWPAMTCPPGPSPAYPLL
jgi:hypothetical protein